MDKTLLIISILFVILFNVASISSKIDRTGRKKQEFSPTEHILRMIIFIIIISFFVAVTYFALSFFLK
jgi:hypothetical protein